MIQLTRQNIAKAKLLLEVDVQVQNGEGVLDCSVPSILDIGLQSNAGNNKARRVKFHRHVRQFLPRDHGGFGQKN